MNTLSRCALVGALFAVSLSAQVTSPAGYLSTEGATNHAYILGSRLGLTWQQVDSTQRGKIWTAKSIAWRRDAGVATSQEYSASTMEVEIFMGDADLTKISTTHTSNYVGQATNVVKKKSVNAPSWINKPATAPANFDFNVPFDTTYVHLGKWDLLWEVRVTKNTYNGTAFSNYPFDFQYVKSGSSFNNGPNNSTNTVLGKGCPTGSASPFTLDVNLANHGTKFSFSQGVSNGPASALVTSFLGVKNPAITLPGWCTALHTDALLPLPVGVTNASGSIKMSLDNIPHQASAIGNNFYFQAVASSAGRLLLSNGVQVVPATDPNFPAVGRVYTYNTTSGTTSSGPWTGGIIARFQ